MAARVASRETYRDNFLHLLRIYMAEIGTGELKVAAGQLGIPYMTMHKISDKAQLPTVEHAQILCTKGGFNANFLLLNKPPIYQQEHTNLVEIKRLLKSIEEKL